MRKPADQGGGFARLNEQQKWEWHAEVYAFRRVVLNVPESERTSPCDADGKWFNPHLVGIAERYHRLQIGEQKRRCQASTRDANAIRFADAERWRQTREGREFLAGARHPLPMAAAE